MILAGAILITVGVIAFTLLVRARDLPPPEPVSPAAHMEERKARIYENLRDLQFEFRVGKLSEEDYQRTKLDLQRELAAVLADIDKITGPEAPKAPAPAPPAATECAHCGAKFDRPLKFCGECGKPMPGATA